MPNYLLAFKPALLLSFIAIVAAINTTETLTNPAGTVRDCTFPLYVLLLYFSHCIRVYRISNVSFHGLGKGTHNKRPVRCPEECFYSIVDPLVSLILLEIVLLEPWILILSHLILARPPAGTRCMRSPLAYCMAQGPHQRFLLSE